MQKKDDLKLHPVIEMLTTILAYKQNNIIAIDPFSLYNILLSEKKNTEITYLEPNKDDIFDQNVIFLL